MSSPTGSCSNHDPLHPDLIEHDGEDLRNFPFLDRKAALTPLLRDTKTGILLNDHVAEDGPTVFELALPAWRRGHRPQEGRRHLSIGSMPGLGQGA